MDNVSQEIVFKFSNIHTESSELNEEWQLMLKIVANFFIEIEQVPVYEEIEFPIVELGVQIHEWLKFHGNRFEYHSMETDDNPLLVFNPVSKEVFEIYSHDFVDGKHLLVSQNSLEKCSADYVNNLIKTLHNQLGIDIKPVLK